MQRSDMDGMFLEESLTSYGTLGASLKSCSMDGVTSRVFVPLIARLNLD